MRILIDECLPRKLKRELPDHEVKTVPEMGWSGVKNGALLRLMAGRFDVFITIDQNLRYQQNLQNAPVGVILLSAPSNRLDDLLPLIPQVREALFSLKAGVVIRISSGGSDTPPPLPESN
jgi:hypothetical protein